MTQYYTSAQLAFFRSALALLANSVEQGGQVISKDISSVDTGNIDQKSSHVIFDETDAKASLKIDAYATTQSVPSSIEPNEPKVKHIFSGLGWFSKKKDVSSDQSSKLVVGVEEQGVVNHVSNVVEITSREHPKEIHLSTVDTRITRSFFSELPWAAQVIGQKVESIADTLGATDVQSPITQISSALSHSGLSARSFFEELPWIQPPVRSPLSPSITSPQPYIATPKNVVDLNLTNLADSAATGIYGQTAKSFFSDMPWLHANVIRVNGQHTELSANQDKPDHQTDLFAASQIFELNQPVGRYFQSLPWQDKPIVAIAAFQGVADRGNDDIASIFSAASQSALLAAQKSHLLNSQQGNKKIDTFFSSLPWDGPR
ncbi:hypothetical protein [Crenothrix sp.]|uniref:hypothetical protein n=1 Tax=Crenothrix sp. TaxID=3100433 RepID=UPI00374D0194